MQQSSRGPPRPLVSPLPSPTLSHAESNFSVSKYASSRGPASSSMSYASVAPPLQKVGATNAQPAQGAVVSPEDRIAVERVFSAHWSVFRMYLTKDGSQSHARQNKAREKLTRLNSLQFQELSTDVYDEVLRRSREAQTGQSFLPPISTFHPKRNHARQKLASLQTTRFKDLASDVFFEIERRFPNVTTSSQTSRSNASSDRGSTNTNSGNHNREHSTSSSSDPRSLGSRQPNVFRQTAVIPMTSTMLEDDGDSEEEVGARASRDGTRHSSSHSDVNRSTGLLNKNDKQTRESFDQSDRELRMLREANREMEAELSQLRIKDNDAHLRSVSEMTTEISRLKLELAEQQKVTEDVRHEAQGFLKEMRELSERESAIYEQAENLQAQVTSLETDLQEWKDRYYKTKTQLRQVKATSQFFSPIPDFKVGTVDSIIRPDGVIRDFLMTKFQSSIDTLLRTARANVEELADAMKEVILNVRAVLQDMDDSKATILQDVRIVKLKQRMSNTTNNLMTACKNHIRGGPLSPVSLVDAAASHLASTIIEIAKMCKLRPTLLNDADDEVDTPQQQWTEAKTQRLSDDRAHASIDQDSQDTLKQPQREKERRQDSSSSNDYMRAMNHYSEGRQDVANNLQLFLESQTESIVKAIQRLLSAVRTDARTAVLQTYMSDIVTIVAGVTSSMREAFEGSMDLRGRATGIVTELESCITRMREMENAATHSGELQPSKEFKQRLAGIAYDTAKQTKELSIVLRPEHDEPDLT